MTYADHQEAASRALLRLFSSEHPDLGDDADVVLQCREHAIATLVERLEHLGASLDRTPGHIRVDRIARRPREHLVGLLAGLHRNGPGATAPSDLLPGPAAAAARTPADLWRCVARELMLGTHDLITADRQPWTILREAGWYVLGDAANIVEALVVLDQRLSQVGLLPAEPRHQVLARRLAAGDVARMAGWFGTDNSADFATPRVSATLGLGGGPRIYLVRGVTDFAPAQRALAGFLRPTLANFETGSPQERPGLVAARALAVGQIRLAETFARWAERYGAQGATLAEAFRSRVPAYQELHRSTLRLTEVEPRRSPLILAQQSELVTQLRALRPDGLSLTGLVELNQATHELTVTTGKALRVEGMHRKNILTLVSRDVGLPEPQPITNSGHRFNAACRRLADDPAPTAVVVAAAPVQRERLRLALSATSDELVRSGPRAPVATARPVGPRHPRQRTDGRGGCTRP